MKCKKFIFENYNFDFNSGKTILNYSIDEKIKFSEILFFPIKKLDKNKLKKKKDFINKVLFNLHLAGGLSYWKTYCPQKIIIKSGKINKEQAKFWNKLYYKGMGQFYFENKLDPKKTAPEFPYKDFKIKPIKLKNLKSNLLPWGGGKDSIVSSEILKKQKKDFTLFYVGDSIPQKNTAKIAKKKTIIVKRIISPKLKKLPKAYNGHIPVSAYYAFVEVFTAGLFGFKNIAMSNEKSANYGNILYKGLMVNHQYSKSQEFEKDFSEYLSKFITKDIKYFSLLRKMSEIEIAEQFTQYPKYFKYFSSCNTNFRQNKRKRPKSNLWCGSCPKCAFVFLILSAFLSKKKLLKIFKKDLFNDPKLENTFLELLGKKNHKPFECVGTPEEVKKALSLVIKKQEFKNSYFIKKQ
ncbi:MAG: hypothetical protein GWO87_01115 [Xanthomonadaceae bacterium]|nr:hypothetical protein [Rhodospirillaceae bacterium]NIA17775.1 hypothetical protein [Xanthomonadaceae bacterium]